MSLKKASIRKQKEINNITVKTASCSSHDTISQQLYRRESLIISYNYPPLMNRCKIKSEIMNIHS